MTGLSLRGLAIALITVLAGILVPAATPMPVMAANAITIVSPLTDQTVSGSTLLVSASASGASSTTYSIAGGPSGSMTLDAASNLWRASIDLSTVPAGARNVTVTGLISGSSTSDTAWRVNFPGASVSAAPASAAAGPPSITIANPLSNQAYSGSIVVQARASNAASVAYVVDGGAAVAMTYNAGNGLWQASLDTTKLSNSTHNVDVVNHGSSGATASDRAWNIRVSNASTSPTPVPAPIAPSTTRAWGVNYSGAEFNGAVVGTLGTDYIYPAEPARDSYFAGKGLKLVRLPITWERLQRQAYGPLSAPDLAAVEAVLDTSAASGQTVIIDLHNFGRYYGTPLTVAQAPMLANFWQQLAAALRGHAGLYGYELMNEPHDLPEGGVGWAAIAQAATTAVRQSDTSAWILVPGYGWQTATFWATNNPTLNVQDPANHLEYAAHLYFDSDYSGTYATSYDASGAYPTIGTDRLQPFLQWLGSHNVHGILTEYGVPNTDARWLTVLDNFLNTLSGNSLITGGTYWSAGPWWGSYPLSVEPSNGQDKPQMAVLAKYATR